jgi:subtilisin family serine protease
MKNSTITHVLFLLIISFQSLAQFGTNNTIQELNSVSRVDNEYIVILNEDIVNLQAQAYSQANKVELAQATEIIINDMCLDLAVQAQGTVLNTYAKLIYGFALSSNYQLSVTQIITDQRVKYVEVNKFIQLNTTQLNPTWGLDRIDQINLPLNNSYIYNQDGVGVHVYVIDTGIAVQNPEFEGRADFIINLTDDGQGDDCHGHGTHVAGIIGSHTYGVAKQVFLHAIKVRDCGGGNVSQGTVNSVVQGLDKIKQILQRPAVINISLGIIGQTGPVKDAVNAMINNGVSVVVSAGNDDRDACMQSPANVANTITVGATTISDARWVNTTTGKASNFGSCVDIFAPGTEITSVGVISATDMFTGTSQAAPHVTGAVALYLQDHPTATPAEVKQTILSMASIGLISNVGPASPNKLLNTVNSGDGYEQDDITLSDNNTIGINKPAQQHNFADDAVDWIKLTNGELGAELNVQPGACNNLSCGMQISNVVNTDLCIQFYDANGSSQVQCGLTNGYYSDINLVVNSTGPSPAPSQCDADYMLGWSHVKVYDNSGTSGNNKTYDIQFNCSYDPPGNPDVYEDDDLTADNFNTIGINNAYQHHNFHDDSQDWIRFIEPGTIGAQLNVAAGACNNLVCNFEITNISNLNMCVQFYGNGVFGPQTCGLTNNTYTFGGLAVANTNATGPFQSQCDADYKLNWTHIKLSDFDSIADGNKTYDTRLDCVFNPESPDSVPDFFEDDDSVFSTIDEIAINGVGQHHNFYDDAYDLINLPTIDTVISELGLNPNVSCENLSCKIRISNQNNVDLCSLLVNGNSGPYPGACNIPDNFESVNLIDQWNTTSQCSSHKIEYNHVGIENIAQNPIGVDKSYDVELVCTNN